MVNLNEEKKLWRQGYECVVGLDEAGRGPLAGPVVAAAVALRNFKSLARSLSSQTNSEILNFKSNQNLSIFKGINDSKKLSEKRREELYKILTSHQSISWGVGIISEKVIDRINILEATKLAMQKAHSSILQNAGMSFLLIDGNFKIPSSIPQKSIIKGDSKVFSIAAASIIAKVTRDRIMKKMHEKYPQYAFDKHKGYGTAVHVAILAAIGPCAAHRKTFYPVRASTMV